MHQALNKLKVHILLIDIFLGKAVFDKIALENNDFMSFHEVDLQSDFSLHPTSEDASCFGSSCNASRDVSKNSSDSINTTGPMK